MPQDQQRYQQIIEASPSGMILADQRGEIILVNKMAEELFGYTREELLGMSVERLVPPRSRGKHPGYSREFYKQPKTRPMGAGRDLYGLKKDGSEVPVEIGLSPMEMEGGVFVLASIIDIRERKRLEEKSKELTRQLKKKNEELEQLGRLKDEFVSNVSHELRTPLTIIRESVSQIADGLFGKVNKKQNKYLDMSLTNVDRLGKIVDDLLDTAAVEQGKLKLDKEDVDMTGLVREIIANFTPQVEKRGLAIRAVVPKRAVSAFVDKEKMARVLTNLVGNAYKFTDKGHIEVSVSENDTNIECCVRDTGIGIASQDLPRLFSKFERLGGKQSGPGLKGTGLGLSIAKSIIELHGGQIKVESEPGQGTRFIITLPKDGRSEQKDA